MLVLASASPRRRELLTQAGFIFSIHPADIPEDPLPDEDPIAYVTRLARQKAEAVFRLLMNEGAPSISRTLRNGWESTNPDQANPPQPTVTSATSTTSNAFASNQPGAPGLDFQTGESTNPNPQSAIAPGAPPIRLFSGEWMGTNEPLTVLGADTTVTLDNLILGKPQNPADAARMLRLLSGRAHRVITGVALVSASRTEVAAEVTTVQFLPLSEQTIADYIATGEPMDKAGAYAIQGRAARWIPRIEGDYFNVVGLPLALVSTLLEAANLPSQSSVS